MFARSQQCTSIFLMAIAAIAAASQEAVGTAAAADHSADRTEPREPTESISALGSLEGLDNLQEGHQPAMGAVLSYAGGSRFVLYASPTFVDGTLAAERLGGPAHDHEHDHGVGTADDTAANADGAVTDSHDAHDGTVFVGLGARMRLLPSVFISAEVSPRLAGHDPGDAAWGVALEKTTRGHTLALTLTNTYAMTPGQLARGGADVLHLGFDINRRFQAPPSITRSHSTGG